MRIPENQIEFEKMFTTEEQCLDYLKELWYNRQKSNSRGLLFQRLIEQGALHEPFEYKSIKRM